MRVFDRILIIYVHFCYVGASTIRTYNRAGRLHQVRDGNTVVSTYEYFANGALMRQTMPGGITKTYTYFPNNQLHTLVHMHGNMILEAYQYAYDGAGNMLAKMDVRGLTTYTYTALNQLATVTEPCGRVTAYIYDRSGNRWTETINEDGETTVITYEVDERNRLINTTTVDSDSTRIERFTYDANGNLISRIPEKLHHTSINPLGRLFLCNGNCDDDLSPAFYTFNPRGQMIEATNCCNTVINTFNADGLRHSKTVDGITTYFLYDRLQIIKEIDSDGIVAYNVYGNRNLILRDVDGERVFYLHNGNGDVTALLNAAGQIIVTYYYDAFGNILEATGNFSNPFRYAGYMFDASVGLYYLNARFYDSRIARFMSEDPLFRANNLTSTDTSAMMQTLNLYVYCGNNPLRYWDPTGLSWVENAHGVRTWCVNSSPRIEIPEHLLAEHGNFRNDVFINEITVRNGHFTNNGNINILHAENSYIVNNGFIGTINLLNSVLRNNRGGTVERAESRGSSAISNDGFIGSVNVASGSEASILNSGFIQSISINSNSMANIANMANIGFIENLTVFNNAVAFVHRPTELIVQSAGPLTLRDAYFQYRAGSVLGYINYFSNLGQSLKNPKVTGAALIQSVVDDPWGTLEAINRRNPLNYRFLWYLGEDIVNAHVGAFNEAGFFGLGHLHGGYAGQATVVLVNYGVGKAVAGTPAPPAAGGTAQKSAARPAGSLPAGRYRVVNQQPASGAGNTVVFGSNAKSAQRLTDQMNARGWTESSVRHTVNTPHTTRDAFNRATGNDATAFFNRDGSHVVIDNTTREVVQIATYYNVQLSLP